jgi:DNA (cytosine-5)-methyltransferase 1
MKPRLLDLFCGAGGAAMGYYRAGFEVVGVDINPQPNYPFEFIQADALEWLSWTSLSLPGFDVVHASPPCQAYSWSAKRWDVERADLLAPTRELLRKVGLPYVIENVVGAPMESPIRLCGVMFGLEVIRHRLFESNVAMVEPWHAPHQGSVQDGTYVTVAGHGGDNIKGRGSRAAKQRAMGIDWMSDEELNQAIPPAYTEWIGRQLLQVVERAA